MLLKDGRKKFAAYRDSPGRDIRMIAFVQSWGWLKFLHQFRFVWDSFSDMFLLRCL